MVADPPYIVAVNTEQKKAVGRDEKQNNRKIKMNIKSVPRAGMWGGGK